MELQITQLNKYINNLKNNLLKINYDFKEISKDKKPFFLEFTNLAKEFKGKEVCNMTLDELLDKISQYGIGSLSDLEKQKLEVVINLII